MLCVDLFCGLGGWAEGFLSEGWDVVGFDIERHVYGEQRYPAQLVIQDVLTLDGRQFRDADCIVASPPCQRYSYMAMPWGLAKREVRWQQWERDSPFGDRLAGLNALFAACFRIQREACEAAGRHIPMVVENVKGSQPWVGRARANFGSFYFWGDVSMVGSQVVAGRLQFGQTVKAARRPDRQDSISSGELRREGIQAMTNAEKERTCALARALDKIAIPLIYAGASPNEAYRAALSDVTNVSDGDHISRSGKLVDAARGSR